MINRYSYKPGIGKRNIGKANPVAYIKTGVIVGINNYTCSLVTGNKRRVAFKVIVTFTPVNIGTK